MTEYRCPRCKTGHLIRDGKTPAGKTRWACRTNRVRCYSTTNPGADGIQTQSGIPGAGEKKAIFRRSLTGSNRFLITAAQNATPVHKEFLASLELACSSLNAELVVVPIRYKNPTSRWSSSQANEEVWAPELQPYLFNRRKMLNRNLVLLGDIKTQPTAMSPLSGFDALTMGESGILPHTKLEMKTIPTPQSAMPKILTTTGAVTVENYTDSKAGALGRFHHTLGACLAEVGSREFHLRQINADKGDGRFHDLDKVYGADWVQGGVGKGLEAEALVLGDTHVDFADPEVVRATDEMIEVLKPRHIIWHDLCDSYSVNPHHKDNPFITIAKMKAGKSNVLDELSRAVKFVAERTPAGTISHIVFSNHPEMLRRWMVNTDWRRDPVNAQFYLATASMMAEGANVGRFGTEYPDPFMFWGRKLAEGLLRKIGGRGEIRFLAQDESLQLAGVEVSMHGDSGPNGARGSRYNLRRIGVKSVIGHTHSPGISEGCYQVGTMTALKAEYTSGPSGWLNTHCVIYPNGKRSLLNIIKGKWRI